MPEPGGGGGRCGVGRALDEVWGIAVSPDGRNVYHVSAKVNAHGDNRAATRPPGG